MADGRAGSDGRRGVTISIGRGRPSGRPFISAKTTHRGTESSCLFSCTGSPRSGGLSASRDRRCLAPSAARHASGGSTNMSARARFKRARRAVRPSSVPSEGLVAPVLGDRVGRLRETPAAAAGPIGSSEDPMWCPAYALSRIICQDSGQQHPRREPRQDECRRHRGNHEFGRQAADSMSPAARCTCRMMDLRASGAAVVTPRDRSPFPFELCELDDRPT